MSFLRRLSDSLTSATSALSLAVLALSACRGNGDPILLGLAGPFSETRGTSMRLAADLAVEQINGAGGVRGRPLALVVVDDSADGALAARLARDLVLNPAVVAVIGHLTSGTTIAAAPVYNEAERPVVAITPSASNPQIGGLGAFTFRACPHDLVHGTRLALWAQERLGARRAGVLYLNDDYGRGIRTAFSQSFTALGGAVVSEDPYLLTIDSFEPYLSRLRALGGVDVLMIAGSQSGAERILATLDSIDFNPTIVGGDGLTGIERSASADAEGVYISEAYLPDRPGSRNAAFVAAYRAAYGNRPLDHRGATTYDIVHLLARAIEEVGTERAAIREYLAGVGTAHPAFEGVTGQIAFDEDGEVPAKDVVIGVVRDGRIVTAPGQ